MGDELGYAGRILLALLLGGLIGVEREASGHPAGFRTHIMVALGAALFGIVSVDGFHRFVTERAETNVQVDVTRVASQVVVGIGFLGAGTIVRHRGSVRGLTTAASLWVTCAVGLAVGVAAYGPAVITTLAVLLSLVVLRFPGAWISDRIAARTRTVSIQVAAGSDPGQVAAALHEQPRVRVRSLSIRQSREGTATIEVDVRPLPGADLDAVLADLSERDDIDEIEVS